MLWLEVGSRDTGFMTEQALFLNALECTDSVERAAYLDAVCAGDAALRTRIEALLRSSAAAGPFLDVPVVEQLADHAAGRAPAQCQGKSDASAAACAAARVARVTRNTP